MQGIMNSLYKDQTPTPPMVLEYIIKEIKAQIRARPMCLVSAFLKGLLSNMNTNHGVSQAEAKINA